VVGVQREESQKVTFSKCERTDSLAQAKGVHFRAVRCLQVLDRLPVKPGVPAQRVPVQLAEAAKRSDNLSQFGCLRLNNTS
jgi:hypothetical protein